MSDEKTLTEREAVLRERAAIRHVVGYLAGRGYLTPGNRVGASEDPRREVEKFVLVRFPLPKITRPRVVGDPGGSCYDFRVVDGQIEERCRTPNAAWRTGFGFNIDAERVAVWADLLANPTEEVEEGTP